MDLSIIIPTHNPKQRLSGCLQSITHNDAEIIVVDDGSDAPIELPRGIRVVRHEHPRGRSAAVNTGARLATNDLLLIMDDDIHAAPDMVVRMVDEFVIWNNPKLVIAGRTLWDPEVRMTATMRWMEEFGPVHDTAENRSGLLSNLTTRNTVFWRPFYLEDGGLDESFPPGGLEDADLGLRLKGKGLEIRLLGSAVGYRHRTMRVTDLVARELEEGFSAVYLHSKFPEFIPQVEDVESLMRNLEREKEALAAVEELSMLEIAEAGRIPAGAADLFMLVYRHYFLKGIVNGLSQMGTARRTRRNNTTLALFDQAAILKSSGELGEARRMYRLVREREDDEYWADAAYHLGLIEATFGNHRAARSHFSDCLSLNPDHLKAGEALQSSETASQSDVSAVRE